VGSTAPPAAGSTGNTKRGREAGSTGNTKRGRDAEQRRRRKGRGVRPQLAQRIREVGASALAGRGSKKLLRRWRHGEESWLCYHVRKNELNSFHSID
jgi:hypothetical protein